MDKSTLRQENRTFRQTRGVSKNNKCSGFRPAFLDKQTGRIELAVTRDGQTASMHLISWLPAEWATERAVDGTILAIKDTVICGFVRDGIFYTRAQAAELVL